MAAAGDAGIHAPAVVRVCRGFVLHDVLLRAAFAAGLMVTAGGALGIVVTPPVAGAASTARGLVVSTPAGQITAEPGTVVHTEITVADDSTSPMTVDVTMATVHFGSNGSATIAGAPDRTWADRVTVAQPHVTLLPEGYTTDDVTVTMPSHLSPDDYYLGFLVTRQPTGTGNVNVVSQIGALLDLDVPGPRVGVLRLKSVSVPSLSTTGKATIMAVVANPGHTFVTAWGEMHVQAFGSPNMVVSFPGRYTVAPGSRRTLSVTVDLGAGVWPVKMQAAIYYNARPATVAQLGGSGTMWLIDPPFLPAIPLVALALAVTVVWWSRRMRSRSPQRVAAAAVPGAQR